MRILARLVATSAVALAVLAAPALPALADPPPPQPPTPSAGGTAPAPAPAATPATTGTPSPTSTPSVPGIGTIPAGLLADPTASAPGLLAQLGDLQTKLQAAQAAQELAAQQLQATQDALAEADQRLSWLAGLVGATQSRLDEVYARWTRRVQAAYEQGPAWQAAALLSPDPTDTLQEYATLGLVVHQDHATFTELTATRDQLQDLQRQAQRTRDDRARLTAEAAGHTADLAAATAQVQSLMDGTTAQLKASIADFQGALETARRRAFDAYLAALGRGGTGTPGVGAAHAAQVAVAFALDQMGKPYVFGAEGPASYDCSGLTQAAYAAAGVHIPRIAADQYAGAGPHVALVDLLPGDLVFYASDLSNPATVHHVGMYLGGGLMVNAPHTGAVVSVGSVWQTEYIGAVRVVGAVPGGPVVVTAPPQPSATAAPPAPTGGPTPAPGPGAPSPVPTSTGTPTTAPSPTPSGSPSASPSPTPSDSCPPSGTPAGSPSASPPPGCGPPAPSPSTAGPVSATP